MQILLGLLRKASPDRAGCRKFRRVDSHSTLEQKERIILQKWVTLPQSLYRKYSSLRLRGAKGKLTAYLGCAGSKVPSLGFVALAKADALPCFVDYSAYIAESVSTQKLDFFCG